MADIVIQITIPDAFVPRAQAQVDFIYPGRLFVTPTPPNLLQWLKQSMREELKRKIIDAEKANTLIPDITITNN